MSVKNYHYSLRNNGEEFISQFWDFMRRVWAANMSFRIPDLESVFAFKSHLFWLHRRIQSSLPSVVTLLVTIQCKFSTTLVIFTLMSRSDKTETLSGRFLISGMEGHTRKIKGKCGECASVSLHILLKCNIVLSGRNMAFRGELLPPCIGFRHFKFLPDCTTSLIRATVLRSYDQDDFRFR
jgi:hypothetical protein